MNPRISPVCACLQKRLQIGAGDENRFLCRDNDQTAQRSVAFDRIEMFIQARHRRGVENVRARFGAIEGQDANAIVADLALNHWSV